MHRERTYSINTSRNEALKAIDVVLAYWDQEYFSLATAETNFTPFLHAPNTREQSARASRQGTAARSSVTQPPATGRASVAKQQAMIRTLPLSIKREPFAGTTRTSIAQHPQQSTTRTSVAHTSARTSIAAKQPALTEATEESIPATVQEEEAVIEPETVVEELLSETDDRVEAAESQETAISNEDAVSKEEQNETEAEPVPETESSESHDQQAISDLEAQASTIETVPQTTEVNSNVEAEAEASKPLESESAAELQEPVANQAAKVPESPPKQVYTPVPRTPLNQFDYTYRAGKGGKGWWKYLTRHRGTDPDQNKAQYQTLWFTPTPRAPIPRATAGVWFIYEKHDPPIPASSSSGKISKSNLFPNGLNQIATLHYRYEHSHMTHTIEVPSVLEYLPLVLVEHDPDATAARLSAPLTVSHGVETHKFLKPLKPVPAPAAALEIDPETGDLVQIKVNGNGVPLEVIKELGRTENYPVLTAREVIMRHHLLPENIAKIPAEDEKYYADVLAKHLAEDEERKVVVEGRKQQRYSSV
ncbi:hypothetical protein BCR33DRAFT_846141 [Rhizoclosmatium globosum]|uniref:Uncharacterized protein n=1 Tax=Rhizoclosmatium globosum TaxID=329046 RepID=A0A1Y2CYA0_9FUNG|nr:hypothetical protein BCR33DRAFT_846141 [Rhizoclosmatium globosum]|eukprot:ORY51315.1 hypothetical protein BCR33DRAFT_846141 [Rhizoclosmatium globosum]